MGEAYYDPRSIQLRLDRTICLYKGEPVYVEARNVSAGLTGEEAHKMHVYSLTNLDKKARIVDYRVPEFDYRAFPLGYMNYQGHAHYLTRVPSRIQKQGLCRHAIASEPALVGSGWYLSESLRNTILNIYPSYSKALDMLEDGSTSVAFHRVFAIENNNPISLVYKGRLVGFQERNGKYRLIDCKEAEAIRMLIKDNLSESDVCLVH